jgi:outer membrane protein TolC
VSPARARTTAVIVFFTIAFGGFAARAQPSVRELSLDQALAMARKVNRTLIAERARLAQAQANLELAWTALFPTVAAQGKYTRNNIEFKFPLTQTTPTQLLNIQPKNQLDGAIGFTAPIIVPAAYPAVDAVQSTVHASEADFETSQATVLFGVAQAFYAAAISDEVMAARQSSIDVAHATLQNAQTRFAAGTVAKVDVDRAELALVRAEQAAREARFGHAQAYRALATLIQAENDFKVLPLAATPTMDETPSLDSALRLRPEFRSLELVVRSAGAQRRAYAWRWAPTLSAFGSARAFNYDNFAQQHHAWAVGAQLDWVLYDGGVRDAQRHLADAQAREADARAEVLRDTIRDDLANNDGLLETKRQAQEAAERSVVLAVETLDLVRTQYEAGNTAQIDLLQAQDGLVAAKEALAQAHFEVAIADLTLRRAAGTFPGK